VIIVMADGDEECSETFADLAELATDLSITATDEYREEVLRRLKAGEKRFTVSNGDGTETYVVSG
jgi:hypothetical protein